MITYTSTIQGVDVLVRRAQSASLVVKPLEGLLNEASLIAQRVAREGAPRDTATLQRSIVRQVTPLMARVYTPLAYAAVMEEGRRPGAKMPPPDALRGWARRHGIPESALFVLARAIGKRGIKGRFFFRAAKEATEAEFPRLIQKMAAAIKVAWTSGEAAGGGG